jgi:dUTP pyrophosphatase
MDLINTLELKWVALDHCPKGQLVKANPTDAGFDIKIAEDVVLNPDKNEFTWVEVCEAKDFTKEIPDYYRLSGHIKEENGILYRRKYKAELVKTGICIKPSQLMWNALHIRSSIATKFRTSLANNIGVIDFSYSSIQDELMLALISDSPMIFHKGERLAQLIPMSHIHLKLKQVDKEEFEGNNVRGGFGSSGI